MKMKSLIFCLMAISLTACNSTQRGLYWGSYSETLYEHKQTPNENTRANHLKSLRDIVTKSESKGTRIPPGVMIEIALMEIENGNSAAAMNWLDKELVLYPESVKIVSIIKARMGA